MRLPVALTCLLAPMLPAFAAASPADPPVLAPPVHVMEGAWGEASLRDIETVLTSVEVQLLRDFRGHDLPPIRVAYSSEGPSVLFDRDAAGEYQVFLSAQDTRWDQFAYQFGHELCHVLSNHAHRVSDEAGPVRANQWFEEAICDAVAILSLERLAKSWQQSPPYPNWRWYAPAFGEYAERLLQQRHRRLPAGTPLAAWYAENRQALRQDPYLRDKTELAATALLELFRREPGNVAAIGHLNEDAAATAADFEEYLRSWNRCCPDAQRSLVLRAMALFGVQPEGPQHDARSDPPPRPGYQIATGA